MVFGVPAIFLGILFTPGGGAVLLVGYHLIAGWGMFLSRVLPRAEVIWPAIISAAVCCVALLALLHRLGSWLFGQIQRRRGTPPAAVRPWRWRWTVAAVGVLFLAFTAGLAAVGVLRQLEGLVDAPEPLARHAVHWFYDGGPLHRISIALHQYHGERKHYPAGATVDARGRLLHGWQTRLLPYLDHDALYQAIDPQRPWDDAANLAHFRTRIPEYLHPGVRPSADARGLALSHWAGNVRVLGGTTPLRTKDFTDGLAHTILVGEVRERFKPWGHPANWRDPALGLNRSPDGFGCPIPGGVQFLMADGAVRVLKPDTDPRVLRALSTPRGGETIPWDDLR
jgi:hypothetical protein